MNFGWFEFEIGTVAEPVDRSEQPIPGVTYRQVGVRLWGQGAYERDSIDGGNTKYGTLNRTARNDIIVNKIWARNGSVSVILGDLNDCFVSSEFPLFKPNTEKLEPKWFYWITKTRWFWQRCDEQSRGTSGKNRIRPEKFSSIKIPLPPLSEQQRIVAKIELLAAKVEDARGLRQQIGIEIQAYLNGVLASTFDLNKSNHPFKTFGEVCETTSGGTPSRQRFDFYSGDIPWIKSGELEDCIITRADEHISQEALSASNAKLFPAGTLLVALYGATVGKTGVLGMNAATNQAVCAIFPDESLDRNYVWWFLKRMRPVYLNASIGGAQPNISQKILRESQISVPPVSEQRRIVAYLDGLQAQVDRLKALQTQTAVELEALLPSILDKAFKGKL